MGIRVRALVRGHYGHALRERGSTFVIASEKELGSWMDIIEQTDEKASIAPTPTFPNSDDWAPLIKREKPADKPAGLLSTDPKAPAPAPKGGK